MMAPSLRPLRPAARAVRRAALPALLGALCWLAGLAGPVPAARGQETTGSSDARGEAALPAGQESDREEAPRFGPGQIEFSLLAGALAPLSRLSEDPETFSTELAASGLFALDGTVWVAGRLGVAVRAAYAPVTVSVVPGGLAGAVPEDLGPGEYWSVSVEARARFRPPGEGIELAPYLSAGGGLRRLDVRAQAGPEVEDSTDPMVAVAGGATLPLAGPVELRLEIRESLTLYETPAGESRLQSELGALVGGSVRIR